MCRNCTIAWERLLRPIRLIPCHCWLIFAMCYDKFMWQILGNCRSEICVRSVTLTVILSCFSFSLQVVCVLCMICCIAEIGRLIHLIMNDHVLYPGQVLAPVFRFTTLVSTPTTSPLRSVLGRPPIFYAQRSSGKVMFLVVCVCSQGKDPRGTTTSTKPHRPFPNRNLPASTPTSPRTCSNLFAWTSSYP